MAVPNTEETNKVSLKLLVDTQKNKVVYAEAGYQFVDILFSFLTLPMGTIIRLLRKVSDSTTITDHEALGNMKRLYQSLENLPSGYLCKEECKTMLLNVRSSSQAQCNKLQLNVDAAKYYICEDWYCVRNGSRQPLISTNENGKCYCGKLMNQEISLKDCKGSMFVNETTFIITDDLHVMPNHPHASIQTLNDLRIRNMKSLEERIINIGLEEVLELLRWALFSSSPLTSAFLSKEFLAISTSVKSEPNSLEQLNKVNKETHKGSKKMIVRVVVRKSNGKTLYTQADEDFIDFLFSFLTFPLGLVMSICKDNTSLGCIANLYKSMSHLNVGKYFKSQYLKDMLLKPKLAQGYLCKHQLFALAEEATPILFCNIHKSSDGHYSGFLSLTCGDYYGYSELYHRHTRFMEPMVRAAGFVRAPALFMVTNDFVVTPFASRCRTHYFCRGSMDSRHPLFLLYQLKVPLTDVEEHEVSIGMEEALFMLVASLNSPSASTQGLTNPPMKQPKLEV